MPLTPNSKYALTSCIIHSDTIHQVSTHSFFFLHATPFPYILSSSLHAIAMSKPLHQHVVRSINHSPEGGDPAVSDFVQGSNLPQPPQCPESEASWTIAVSGAMVTDHVMFAAR